MATYSPRWISMSTPDTAWISWSPMMYVFHRSYVRMTIPSRLSCSPRSTNASTACAILRLYSLSVDLHWSLVIHLHLRVIADGADHLVTSRDDLVPVFQTAQYLDVRCAGDARLHLAEYSALSTIHYEYALDLFFARLLRRRVEFHGLHISTFRLDFQIAFLPDGQGLNGNGEHIAPSSGCYFRRTRQPGPHFFGRIIERHHHLEILRFLAGYRALRSRETGRPDDGRVADLDHVALECAVRNGIDSDIGHLIQLHVNDVGLIHFHFGGDQRHVGYGHDHRARQIGQARNHGLTHAHRQIGHHTVERRVRIVFAQNIGRPGHNGV